MDVTTLSSEQVRALVAMPDAIGAVRDSFVALARGEFEMPTRTALRDGQFLVMSVHHRPSGTAMFKTLSLNFGGRAPAIVGTVVWSQLDRTDHLVADAGAVTMLRTGAIVGVATDLLAPPDASTCTIIGAGGQAADQVRAVHAVRPLSTLAVVDQDQARAQSLADALSEELGFDAAAGTRPDDAVRGVDIVCCATTATEPLFELESLSPEVHVNAIGAFRPTMRELPDELLADASVLVVDERSAILEESGEIIHALAAGAISESDLVELGAALTPSSPSGPNGRSGPSGRSGRTVFKSVGVASQDWAIAQMLAARSLEPLGLTLS